MQRAMDETDRRRAKQIEHNKKHGIVPKSINKSVADIMEGTRLTPGRKKSGKARAAEPSAKYAVSVEDVANSPAELTKKIEQREQQMYQAAKDLEFETAAQLRDQVAGMREKLKTLG